MPSIQRESSALMCMGIKHITYQTKWVATYFHQPTGPRTETFLRSKGVTTWLYVSGLDKWKTPELFAESWCWPQRGREITMKSVFQLLNCRDWLDPRKFHSIREGPWKELDTHRPKITVRCARFRVVFSGRRKHQQMYQVNDGIIGILEA